MEPPKYTTNDQPKDQRNLSGYGSGLGTVDIRPTENRPEQPMGETPEDQIITSRGIGTPYWQPTAMSPVTQQFGAAENTPTVFNRAKAQAYTWRPTLIFGFTAILGVAGLRWWKNRRGGRSTAADFVDDEPYGDDDEEGEVP